MSSRFGSKAEVASSSPRTSLDKPQKFTPYSTPHDAILAELYSTPDRVVSPEPGSHTDVNLSSKTHTPTLHPYQPSRPPSPDLLLDPFDGTSLGTLVPHSQDSEVQLDHHSGPSQFNLSSPEVGLSQHANAPVPSELVWSHLTNILDLQSQISKMHIKMEGIGSADVKNKKNVFSHKPTLLNISAPGVGSGSKRAGPEDLPVPPGLSTRESGLSTGSTISSEGGEPEGDEENVDVPSEEAEKKKAREEEFASLANQFEGRKQAINDIMGKLDNLFNALSEFHALQIPSLDFPASRQNSSTPANNFSPPAGAESDIKIRIPASQASTSTQLYDCTQLQHPSSSSAVSPPVSSPSTQGDNVLIDPAPQNLKNPLLPTLLVNSMDVGSESDAHNSPVSTPASLKLED